MDPDPPPTSPFQAPPDGSPFRPEPEQPRLGILHLLVWTACVAVYFSITRAYYGEDLLGRDPGYVVFWLAGGVRSGAAVGEAPGSRFSRAPPPADGLSTLDSRPPVSPTPVLPNRWPNFQPKNWPGSPGEVS